MSVFQCTTNNSALEPEFLYICVFMLSAGTQCSQSRTSGAAVKDYSASTHRGAKWRKSGVHEKLSNQPYGPKAPK